MRTAYIFKSDSALNVYSRLFAILAPLSVTQWNKMVLVTLFASSVFALLLHVTSTRKIQLDMNYGLIIVLFLSVFIIPLFSIIINRDYLVGEYLKSVIIGRLFTMVFMVLNATVILLWLSRANRTELVSFLKWCLFPALMFVLLAYWQLIGGLLGIPFFIETRDWMHGVPSTLRAVLPSRLTSIAEEPNFLAPILMETILLTVLLVKQTLFRLGAMFLTLIVVVLSFSGGAYVNLFLLGVISSIFIFLRSCLRQRIGIFQVIGVFIVVSIIVAISYWGVLLFDFISYKLQHEASGGSSRSQFLMSLINMLIESDLVQLIFGHGIGTMSILDEFGLRSEDYLFRITNNFFLDMFWEGGALSVTLILSFMTYLVLIGLKGFHCSNFYFIGMLMTFHLMITATYRSEYLSTHFIWVLTLIMVIYKIGRLYGRE